LKEDVKPTGTDGSKEKAHGKKHSHRKTRTSATGEVVEYVEEGEESEEPPTPSKSSEGSGSDDEGYGIDKAQTGDTEMLQADSEESSSESDSDSDSDDEPGQAQAEEEDLDDDESEVSSGNETITTVSNEVDADSDFDIHDIERQPAQIFPEPPWAGTGKQAGKVGFACLLPLLLVLLVLYGIFKFLQISAECCFDFFNVGTRAIRLLIRLVLSPFLILYHVITPAYIKKHVNSQYDQHIGRRIRFILRVKRFIAHTIIDTPYIILSCALAFIETCLYPARDGCRSLFWKYVGQHIYNYILTPIFAYEINRMTKHKRRHVDASRKDHDMRAARLRNQGKGRRRKKEQHERAKKMKKKLKGETEVKLNVPNGDVDEEDLKIAMREKKPTELFSRTMIVERRYAVGVGFFWSLVGFVLIVVLLDGQKGERCEICVENYDLGVKVCRHGVGRDCAFDLHRLELMISVGVLTIGNIVMIYATFLYRPHGGAARAAEADVAERLRKQEAHLTQGHKVQDPDTAAIEIVREKFAEPTVPRVIKLTYRHSPCHAIQRCLSKLSNHPLKRMYRYEKRKRLAARSMKWSKRFTDWAEKHIIDVEERDRKLKAQMEQHLQKHGVKASADKAAMGLIDIGLVPELKRQKSGMGALLSQHSGIEKHSRKYQVARVVLFPLLLILMGIVFLLNKISCIERCVDRCPKFRKCCFACLEFIRPGSSISLKKDGLEDLEDPGKRLGVRGHSIVALSTVEDVMARFGFKNEDEDEGLEEETKVETEEERAARLKAERPDPLGHVETLRDSGGADEIKDEDDLEPTILELAASSHQDLVGDDETQSDIFQHDHEDQEFEEEEEASHDHDKAVSEQSSGEAAQDSAASEESGAA